MANTVRVKNPHSVLATLETRPKEVMEIFVSQASARADADSDAWARVAQLAKKHGVRVSGSTSGGAPKGDRGKRDAQDGRVSGNEAVLAERASMTAEELFAGAQSKADGHGLWLALDSLQDPHNVGAIFRAAAFFGVQGIMMTSERSAPMTATVYDVACGGVEHVPFTLQTNLQRGFEIAKDKGLWILGSSEHAHDSVFSVERDRPWLLVVGNEESGMRRLTEESCDVMCKIPAKGGVTSLNVSVATGILISQLTR